MKYRILGRLALVAGLLAMAAPAWAQMSLPGKFEVTDTGSASYTIPIQLVPGTSGLEPKLSLQYDSRSGNGLLGVGWSLSGLPSITRCGRTIAQDGMTGGVAYDANDRFCLDGQRLIAISGAYGADQTEYRTERESFSKVISYGQAGSGPAYFKVWTKAGLIMDFGNSTDSRIEAQGKSSVRVWAINKTQDTKGNYFSVAYIEDNANGEYRPDRIDYTGNATAGTAPANSVRFVYETRPDIVPLYQGGNPMKTVSRMVKVQAWQGESLTRDYRVSYKAAAPSEVSGVSLCTASNYCLPVTEFQRPSAIAAGFNNLQNSVISPLSWGGDWRVHTGDLNGDGRADVIASYFTNSTWQVWRALGNGDGTFSAVSGRVMAAGNFDGWQVDVVDINNDGRADIVASKIDAAGWRSRVAMSKADGSIADPVSSTSSALSWGGWTVTFGDFNGDTRPDMLAYQMGGSSWQAWISLGVGDGTFAPATGGIVSGGSWLWDLTVGDVNGDGRTDMIASYFTDGSWQVWTALANTGGFFSAPAGRILKTGNFAAAKLALGDFNNDGLVDLAATKIGTDWTAHTALGKGDGSFADPGPAFVAPQFGGPWFVSFGDFDGDDRADMIANYAQDSSWQAWIAKGGGDGSFATPTGRVLEYGTFNTGSFHFADLNGDGAMDMLISPILMTGWRAYAAIAKRSDWLLAEVIPGNGSITKVKHAALSGTASSYLRDSGTSACTYPCVDVQGPLYVVSEVKSGNGLGGEYRSSYRYAGAKADQHGRGFLGFRQMVVKDEQTGVEQVTSYRQDFPFTGLVASREKKLGTQLLNHSTNSYSATDLGGTRRYPFLTMSLEESWELNNSALPSVTTGYQYDAFGNATQVSVSTGDGHSKVTTNTYQNDEINWHLGRLTRSEVTSTTPSQ